jgi:CRISPR system Cascade subunit CasD
MERGAGARMKVLLLRLDAPLVSFGAPMVDQNGVVQLFPALSMLTGLIANALGWDHRDSAQLDALQERIRYAARIDRMGEAIVDYQTVDLGQPWMDPEKAGWTTRGRIAARGGASSDGTHIRYRHYRADSVHTVAVVLAEGARPDAEEVANAMREPARPLFLGRKCCLPSGPILLGVIEALSPMAALSQVARLGPDRADSGELRACWWDGDDETGAVGHSNVVPVTDERDWANQLHVGRRLMREGRINAPEAGHG